MTEGTGDLIVVALLASVVGPCVLAGITYWLGRAGKEADWARQDAVAAKLEEANAAAKTAAEKTDEKLDRIHLLVNSNLTAAMERELKALKSKYAKMTELIPEPTASDVAEFAALRAQISELQAQLGDRKTVEDEAA